MNNWKLYFPLSLKYEVINSGGVNILKIITKNVVWKFNLEFTLCIGWSDYYVLREYYYLTDSPRNWFQGNWSKNET